ncbi:MAG: hypothetical protein ACE5I1_14355 [bacterium]
MSALIALSILAIYEIFQYYTERWKYVDFRKDAKQDMRANYTGALLCIAVLLLKNALSAMSFWKNLF